MADVLVPGPFGIALRYKDMGDGTYAPAGSAGVNTSWSSASAAGGIVNTTGVTVKAAAGAGLFNYIRSMQVSNLGAAATDVQIRDGASGTVLWRGWTPPASVGMPITFDPPLKGTANTLVEVALGSGVTVAVYVNLQGYTAD